MAVEDEKKLKVLGFEDGKTEISEKKYKEHLQGLLQVKSIAVLTGAGASILKNDSKDVGGLTMPKLAELLKSDSAFKTSTEGDDVTKVIETKTLKKIKSSDDIEQLLSDLDSLILADEIEDGDKVEKLKDVKKSILSFMRGMCVINMGRIIFPHEILMDKLLASRKMSNPRLKVFTLNYDTLFEQAAKKTDTILIDGFSFSQPRRFQGGNFELDLIRRNHTRLSKEESYFPKVAHLYKLHGSVDWEEKGEYIEQIDPALFKDENIEKSVMIYPGSHKYQASYSMPFYEMISRFQSCVREDNTILIIIGYSFRDDHINRIILEAAASNLGLSIYIVSPSAADQKNEKNSQTLKELQRKIVERDIRNIFAVSQDFESFAKDLPQYGPGNAYIVEQEKKRRAQEAVEHIEGIADEKA